VNHGVPAGEGGEERRGVQDVTPDPFHRPVVAVPGPLRMSREHRHVMAAAGERVDEMSPDEAGAARDENFQVASAEKVSE